MLAACIALLALPAAALAGSVYWSDGGAGLLRTGSLSGGAASTLLEGAHEPAAIAIDAAAGDMYFTEAATGSIDVVGLGGGAPRVLYSEPGAQPEGIAIDAAAGRLYWVDEATREIRVGGLGGGSAQTLYTEPEGARPVGLAIEPAAGTLYWADEVSAGGGPGTIRAGATAGGSAQTLYSESEATAKPVGLALDSATGTLYWTDQGSGEIRSGAIQGQAGGAGANTVYSTGAGSQPRGIAIDAATAQLYWADAGSGTIDVGVIAGSAAPGTLFESESGPAFPALLLAPAPSGAPRIAGRRRVGETLRCATGSWSADRPGASLYAAPQTYAYQWEAGGVAIAGASAAEYSPAAAGSYSCTVTAANAAGSAAQSSRPIAVKPQPPTATIVYPTSGSVFERGQALSTSFSCAEGAGGPGLASCKDGKGTSAPAAGRLDTSHVGPHRYFVTAISKDGERSRAVVRVTIVPKKRPVPPPESRPMPTPSRPATPHPFMTIVTGRAMVVGRRARIVLACHRARCAGTLSLAVRVNRRVLARAEHRRSRSRRARRGARARSSVRLLLVKVSYSLRAGERRPVVLRISRQARRLLRVARGNRLTVRARVSLNGGRPRHRSVRLRLRRHGHRWRGQLRSRRHGYRGRG